VLNLLILTNKNSISIISNYIMLRVLNLKYNWVENLLFNVKFELNKSVDERIFI